ncbi:hypothetical protein M8J76_014007 [Diaphorina citri]|nr:hypothetical protein M8J76_014007 [Diaphorina citri]
MFECYNQRIINLSRFFRTSSTLYSLESFRRLLVSMAPRKAAKENSLDQPKPTRVLRPKLQVAPENIVVDDVSPIKEKVVRRKKIMKSDSDTPAETKPKKAPAKAAGDAKSKPAPKAKKVAAKGHKLPDPIKPGAIFVDSAKKSWKVGKSLGSGGFGEVYSATDDVNDNKVDGYKYVMKVEYSTGPLFVEQNFYVRCAKPEHLEAWKKEKKLKTLGLPTFYAMKGQQEHNGNSYRFIIISKFGSDLQKLLDEHKEFSLKNTLTIGSSLLDSLEYIHHCGYVHADLKPANVLLGVDSSQAIVNIVDFGLASRYKDTDDNHKAHIVEKKSAHNGTLIYTSLVAHRGAKTTSRICDIEILAYNLLHLNTGSLPWTAYEQQPEKVLAMKEELLKDPAKFFTTHYKEPVPDVFVEMFKYIASTKFEVGPDYDKLKQMFVKALQKNGLKMDGKLNFEEKKVNGTATSGSSKAEKPKRGNAKKKAAPPPKIVVTQDEDEEEEEGGEEVAPNGDVHIEEEATKPVARPLSIIPEPDEVEEPEPQPTPRVPSPVAHPTAQPVPHSLDETFDVPTPAMIEVMSKRNDKKSAAVKRGTAEEKRPAAVKTYRAAVKPHRGSQDEDKPAEATNGKRRGRVMDKVGEEEDEKPDEKPVEATHGKRRGKVMDKVEEEEEDVEEDKQETKRKKKTAKESKPELAQTSESHNETYTIPTPAMMEFINKRNERKPAASKAKK